MTPSVLAQELLEFEDIVHEARGNLNPLARGSQGRARMFLQPKLVQRLQAHRETWQYLPYHGYGRRELATLEQYTERLMENLSQTNDHPSGIREKACRTKRERRVLLQKLTMDRASNLVRDLSGDRCRQALSALCPVLRNFYFLDMLLAEIAVRLGVSEWTLRCMLPEEVVASLKAGKLVKESIRQRGGECLFALLPDQEHLVAGDQVGELRKLFQTRTSRRRPGKVLQGTIACRGRAVGPCKILIRADDFRQDFVKGSIVVSESTDPDLIGFLRNAGGVLTEQAAA